MPTGEGKGEEKKKLKSKHYVTKSCSKGGTTLGANMLCVRGY